MIDLIPISQEARCQEAAPWSFNTYHQCPSKATTIIYHQKDGRGYYMCTGCAEHNIHNRGGKIVTAENEELFRILRERERL